MGNSVYSLGFVGGIGAGLKLAFGGEVTQITNIIHEGRQQSYDRMVEEAQQRGGAGITGVTSELRGFHGNIEFLSVASCVHAAGQQTEKVLFSTSGDGQELYCLLDAGYTPLKFVFGNVAYSMGIGGGLLGSLKSLARGEIKEFSDIFNTRGTWRWRALRPRPAPRAPTPWSASRPRSCPSRACTRCS